MINLGTLWNGLNILVNNLSLLTLPDFSISDATLLVSSNSLNTFPDSPDMARVSCKIFCVVSNDSDNLKINMPAAKELPKGLVELLEKEDSFASRLMQPDNNRTNRILAAFQRVMLELESAG